MHCICIALQLTRERCGSDRRGAASLALRRAAHSPVGFLGIHADVPMWTIGYISEDGRLANRVGRGSWLMVEESRVEWRYALCCLPLMYLPLPGRCYVACEPVLHGVRIPSMIWIDWLVGWGDEDVCFEPSEGRAMLPGKVCLLALCTRYLGTAIRPWVRKQ